MSKNQNTENLSIGWKGAKFAAATAFCALASLTTAYGVGQSLQSEKTDPPKIAAIALGLWASGRAYKNMVNVVKAEQANDLLGYDRSMLETYKASAAFTLMGALVVPPPLGLMLGGALFGASTVAYRYAKDARPQ